MTTTNKISESPRKFDAEELAIRQQQARWAYSQTTQSCELVRGSIPNQFLQVVIDHASDGYLLTDYPVDTSPMSYSAQMRKPEHVQEVELKQLDEKVKTAYLSELEKELATFKSRLVAQQLENDEIEQQKKLEKAKAKRLAELQREADNTYGNIIVP